MSDSDTYIFYVNLEPTKTVGTTLYMTKGEMFL